MFNFESYQEQASIGYLISGMIRAAPDAVLKKKKSGMIILDQTIAVQKYMYCLQGAIYPEIITYVIFLTKVYTVFQGELTYGKIGEWRFDKRSYLSGPPPKNLTLPPPGVPESVVCTCATLHFVGFIFYVCFDKLKPKFKKKK